MGRNGPHACAHRGNGHKWQVRQPIDGRFVQRWRSFEEIVRPLMPLLGPDSECPRCQPKVHCGIAAGSATKPATDPGNTPEEWARSGSDAHYILILLGIFLGRRRLQDPGNPHAGI
jgi:hypothetical protein